MKAFDKRCGAAIVAALAYILVAIPAAAEKGIETGAKLECTVTTKGELKSKLTGEARIPLLRGESALTADNGLKVRLGAELSPVAANGTIETVFTPIGFLEIIAGASAGSGWNLPIANGLRMNEREGLHDNELTGDAFSGLVWGVRGGAALQGDLAALKPGAWNHLVFRTYHAMQYRALSSASSAESWLYESDSGENRNGWNYYGNYLLAYRMPVKLNLVGVFIEEDQYRYDAPGGDYWGDEVSRWTFSLAGNYAFTDRLSLMLLVQARTMRNFTGDTGDYGFYQDRKLDTDDERHIEFYRAVATLGWKLK